MEKFAQFEKLSACAWELENLCYVAIWVNLQTFNVYRHRIELRIMFLFLFLHPFDPFLCLFPKIWVTLSINPCSHATFPHLSINTERFIPTCCDKTLPSITGQPIKYKVLFFVMAFLWVRLLHGTIFSMEWEEKSISDLEE